MKKILFIVLGLILAIGAVVGAVFGIKALIAKKNAAPDKTEMLYMSDSYVIGEDVVYRLKSEVKGNITSVTFSIDNANETTLTNIILNYDEETESTSIDTKAKLLSTADMTAGYHMITFYAYSEGQTQRVTLNEEPFMFKLIVASSSSQS